jgi:hypothetical protein
MGAKEKKTCINCNHLQYFTPAEGSQDPAYMFCDITPAEHITDNQAHTVSCDEFKKIKVKVTIQLYAYIVPYYRDCISCGVLFYLDRADIDVHGYVRVPKKDMEVEVEV